MAVLGRAADGAARSRRTSRSWARCSARSTRSAAGSSSRPCPTGCCSARSTRPTRSSACARCRSRSSTTLRSARTRQTSRSTSRCAPRPRAIVLCAPDRRATLRARAAHARARSCRALVPAPPLLGIGPAQLLAPLFRSQNVKSTTLELMHDDMSSFVRVTVRCSNCARARRPRAARGPLRRALQACSGSPPVAHARGRLRALAPALRPSAGAQP